MMPLGNEFLCVGKKNADNRTGYFLIIGNVSDLVPGLCNQMRKILIFSIRFLKFELPNNLFFVFSLSFY